MTDLQATVASAADAAGAHSTAPTLLLQAAAALGRLAESAEKATESGRRPFRIPYEWGERLSELAWLVYLLADQTAVDLDGQVRLIAGRVAAEAERAAAPQDDPMGTERDTGSWI